jgi:hypothetical protein
LEVAVANRILSHLRGNAVAYAALFVTFGGTSYAAVRLATGSVTTRALANGAVTRPKLAPHSVAESNLVKRSLTAADFKPGALRNAFGATTGTAGAIGAAGPSGTTGAAGAPGLAGPPGQDGNASVVSRARGTGPVTIPHGSSTNIPLTGTTWTQAANDLNLVTGAMTIETPSSCTGSFGNAVVISVNGVPNTFVAAPTVPANTSVTMPVLVSDLSEPGSAATQTITAKLANACTKSGEDYTITNAKLDVVSFH